ncbi:hypothetical protein [Aquimarina algicola]|uniref:Uncharacterized protein n=1 Tax=Aquimarina algicola TaxID=2589995 RepID=A0A504J4D5_9FLAO|nr:hypothetical protein [Aquimarina algicola]TPN82768.1 hypothetical protein FHK87_20280 [Aquimarina algicola]
MPEKIELCKSPNEYNEWTHCFNKEENAYQFCGYQGSTTLNQETKIQEDASYHTCRINLQLINLDNVTLTDTLEIDNDFGRMVISGNQYASKLHTPFGIKVQKNKFISNRKREAFVIIEFENYIINKIRNYKSQ